MAMCDDAAAIYSMDHPVFVPYMSASSRRPYPYIVSPSSSQILLPETSSRRVAEGITSPVPYPYIISASSGQLLPETSSRCVAEGITTAHNFEVVNFSLLEGMGIGRFISSSTFSVGGCDWNIRLGPDGGGDAEAAEQSVSVYLHLEGGAAGSTTRVKVAFHLLGKGHQLWNHRSGVHTFSSAGVAWGWPSFMGKSRLRPLLSLNNDCFTIRCVLTVIKDHPRMQDVLVPEPTLRQDYERMMNEGKGKDVVLDVGGKLFWCHGCVLAARSPVFDAELFGPMRKKRSGGQGQPIAIHDMEPGIFAALLHFLYTDSLPPPDHQYGGGGGDRNAVLQHLLVAADRYGVDRLKLMCEEELRHGVDMHSVAGTLAIAEQHQCVHLKDKCVRFIVSPGVLGAIMKTDDYKHLEASCPSVIEEIQKKMENTLKIQ